jgi:hypothetical protein
MKTMKKIILFIFTISIVENVLAQDFAKAMTTAKTEYNAGKLEEAHFALMQAMQEIDLIVGKEVLKLLPEKMDSLTINAREDNVIPDLSVAPFIAGMENLPKKLTCLLSAIHRWCPCLILF